MRSRLPPAPPSANVPLPIPPDTHPMRRPLAQLPQPHCTQQPSRHSCRVAVIALAIACSLLRLSGPLTAADDFTAYRQSVRPLLDAHCIACHGSIRQSAGLRLDHGAAILKGADSGPVVIPHNPADSSLVHKVRSTDPQSQMPPAGEGEHLSEQQITVLSDWIAAGALFPPDEAIPASPSEIGRAHV